MGNDTSHISLEPLLNESTEGTGTNKKLAVTTVNALGVCSNRATITTNGTRAEVTIGTGKRTIYFHNSGAETIYLGGSGVTTATGIPLFQDYTMIFNNVQDDFSIYVVSTATTSTLRLVEFT